MYLLYSFPQTLLAHHPPSPLTPPTRTQPWIPIQSHIHSLWYYGVVLDSSYLSTFFILPILRQWHQRGHFGVENHQINRWGEFPHRVIYAWYYFFGFTLGWSLQPCGLCMFPSIWSHHIIHLIHKSIPSSNPNNYMMIMVGHTLLNLYAMVIHDMNLSKELDQRSLRARGQTIFWPAHQTTNHIFTL
jgi:hypothetical protein